VPSIKYASQQTALAQDRTVRHSAWYVFTIVVSLFSVKVPLFGDDAYGPAIRPDDFLIAFATLLAIGDVRRIDASEDGKFAMRAVLAFVGASVVSSIFARVLWQGNLLVDITYSLRLLEYACLGMFAYLLACGGRESSLHRILVAYHLYFSTFALAQSLGAPIGVSQFDLSRVAGNAAGPYEAAAIAAFFVFYFSARRRWTMVLVAVTVLVLTQSRVTTVVTLLLFAAAMLLEHHRRGQGGLFAFVAGGASCVAFAIVLLIGISGPAVGDRLAAASIGDSWREAGRLVDVVPTATTADQFQLQAEVLLSGPATFGAEDASALIRFTRWQMQIESWAQSPASIVLGLGPGFGGYATDGNYVRLVVGHGLLGLALFGFVLASAWRVRDRFAGLAPYTLSLGGTAIFIDIFVSYKPMVLFFVATGMAAATLRAVTEAKGGPSTPSAAPQTWW
jgi:hypothetical protein